MDISIEEKSRRSGTSFCQDKKKLKEIYQERRRNDTPPEAKEKIRIPSFCWCKKNIIELNFP